MFDGNTLGDSYRELGEAEYRFLTQPFQKRHTRGQDRFTELRRLISQPRVSLEEEVGPDDVFLTPDIYRDRDLRRNALPDFVRRTRARTSASQRDFEVVPGATPS